MTRRQFDKQFGRLLKAVSRDLRAQAAKLFYSGGVDTSGYGDDAILPKIIMKAALADEMDHFAMTDEMQRAAKNLSHF